MATSPKHTSTGASDIFLALSTKRAGKIKGECSVAEHKEEIEVRAWRWAITGGGAVNSAQATARRTYTAMTITKGIDSASTALMSAMVQNDAIKEAKLTLRKAGGGQHEYFVITLSGGRLSHIEHVVDVHGETLENISIAFTKVEATYRPQSAVGSLAGATTFNDEILEGT